MSPSRPRVRRLLLLAGVPALLLAIAFAGRVGAMLVLDTRGGSTYDSADYSAAHRSYSANTLVNWLEPWVASYDLGTSAFRLADYEGAVDALDRALADVPAGQECRVRVNLALAHEALGDAALAEADQAAARDAWSESLRSLGECTSDGGVSPEVAAAAVTESRLRDKLAVVPVSPELPEGREGRRADRLEERNRDAQEQHQNNERRREDDADVEDPSRVQW